MKTEQQDIRWEQRFSNYRKAIVKFKAAINIIKNNDDKKKYDDEALSAIDQLQKEGLIQRFEYTHELAWNIMKDYAEFQGNNNTKGSRDATREAFKMGLISNAEVWMDMIKSRNDTSHTYNEDTAEEIIVKIIEHYCAMLLEFESKMEEIRTGKQGDLFDKEL